jgi:hypothetical protein
LLFLLLLIILKMFSFMMMIKKIFFERYSKFMICFNFKDYKIVLSGYFLSNNQCLERRQKNVWRWTSKRKFLIFVQKMWFFYQRVEFMTFISLLKNQNLFIFNISLNKVKKFIFSWEIIFFISNETILMTNWMV